MKKDDSRLDELYSSVKQQAPVESQGFVKQQELSVWKGEIVGETERKISALSSQLADLTSRYHTEMERQKNVTEDVQGVVTSHIVETKTKAKDYDKVFGEHLMYLKRLDARDASIADELHQQNANIMSHLQGVDNNITSLSKESRNNDDNIKDAVDSLKKLQDQLMSSLVSVRDEMKNGNNMVLDKV